MSELEDFFSDIATAEAKVEKTEEPSIENERSDVAQNQTVAAAESSKPKTAVTGKRKAEASVDPPPPAQAYVPPPPAQAQVPPPPAAKEDSHKKPRAAPAVKLASHHLPSFGVGSSSSSLKVPPPPLVDGANDQGLLFKTIKEAKVEHKQSDKSAARATKTASTRIIAGQKWQDESMLEWPENDFRMFVGNIDPR